MGTKKTRVIKLQRYNCKRCGHSWVPRNETIPRICPKCKSAYWDRPKLPKWKRSMISVEPAD